MSYEILKYASFNKKEQKIYVTSASNNCRPLYYSRYEYSHKDMTFEQNIEYFFVSMLDGNYQGGQAKVKDIYNTLLVLKSCAKNTSFDTDLALKTGRDNGLNHLVAKMYAVPVITRKLTDVELNELIANTIERVKTYDEESVKVYEDLKREYEEKGWVITGSCSRSDVFPGWNLYSRRNEYGEGYILAEHSCYENAPLGFCNTKAGKCIMIPKEYDGKFWWTLSNGWDRTLDDIKENVSESTAALIMDADFWKLFEGLEMGKLPCKDFPYEKFGFELKEVAA